MPPSGVARALSAFSTKSVRVFFRISIFNKAPIIASVMNLKTTNFQRALCRSALLIICSMIFLDVRSQANVFEFDAIDPNPTILNAHVFYDSTAQTLEFNAVAEVGNLFMNAPTATPFTGTAGAASIQLLDIPHHFNTPFTRLSLVKTFDLTQSSFYDPAFVTANGGTIAGAEAALVDALFAGKAYLSIESFFGGGLSQDFLVRAPDASSTFSLLTAALLGLFGFARIHKRTH